MNIAILLMLLCERTYNVASRQHGPLFVQLFIPVVLFFLYFAKFVNLPFAGMLRARLCKSVSVLFRTWQVVMKST